MTTRKSFKKLIGSFLIMTVCLCIIYLLFNKYSSVEKYSKDLSSVSSGETLFIQNCMSCHDIKAETMGPPLGGITKLLTKEELFQFIKYPSEVIASGNKRANNLLSRYKIMMPSYQHLNDEQLFDVLSYINNETQKHNIEPFKTNFINALNSKKHLVDSIEQSNLRIELENYVKIPRTKNHANRKGIATLRVHPLKHEDLLVSDQMGIIYYVHEKQPSEFLNIRETFEDFIVEPGIGSGLGSFTIHPDYLNNGLFYTTHTESYKEKSAINTVPYPDSVGVGLQWVLTEWEMESVKSRIFKGSKREVFRLNTPTTAHGIQDINFAPNLQKGHHDYGMLYLGIGDGGSNNLKRPELADNQKSLLGSIIRIDPLGRNSMNKNYGIPQDNPFVDNQDSEVHQEIWAYGFRNPHRMCWDTDADIMIVADIGEANIEEVNIVKKGKHYGWSVLEGNYAINTKIDLKTVFDSNEILSSKYEFPFGKYDHLDGRAISGGYVYKGPLDNLKNKYIFGDIVTARLFYMNISSQLKDNTIYHLKIIADEKEIDLSTYAKSERSNLRIGYNDYTGDLFIMTKDDGMIRKVSKAYFQEASKLQDEI